MKVAALCPTFGKPVLLQNALAQFQAQTYDANTPGKMRRLFILEDAGQFQRWLPQHVDIAETIRYPYQPSEEGADWSLFTFITKFPTLTSKYAFLVERAKEWGADACVVWDDDDIYLPTHIENHVAVLKSIRENWQWSASLQGWINSGWSHPRTVYSLYTGSVVEEHAQGRFHSALAFTRKAGERVHFWGPIQNGRCDYDQGIMGRLASISPPGHSDKPPTLVYRWGSTATDHCSGRCQGPEDRQWYTATPISQGGRFAALKPLLDAETRLVYDAWNKDPAGIVGMRP